MVGEIKKENEGSERFRAPVNSQSTPLSLFLSRLKRRQAIKMNLDNIPGIKIDLSKKFSIKRPCNLLSPKLPGPPSHLTYQLNMRLKVFPAPNAHHQRRPEKSDSIAFCPIPISFPHKTRRLRVTCVARGTGTWRSKWPLPRQLWMGAGDPTARYVSPISTSQLAYFYAFFKILFY